MDRPEVYEKINAVTERGVVFLFASAGRYTYVTETRPTPGVWHTDGVTVSFDEAGHAKLETVFPAASAKLLFFGVSTDAVKAT